MHLSYQKTFSCKQHFCYHRLLRNSLVSPLLQQNLQQYIQYAYLSRSCFQRSTSLINPVFIVLNDLGSSVQHVLDHWLLLDPPVPPLCPLQFYLPGRLGPHQKIKGKIVKINQGETQLKKSKKEKQRKTNESISTLIIQAKAKEREKVMAMASTRSAAAAKHKALEKSGQVSGNGKAETPVFDERGSAHIKRKTFLYIIKPYIFVGKNI